MAVRKVKELLDIIKRHVGDDTSDDTIEFIEDVTDTLNSYEDAENWKERFETNDREWREKYRNRFFNKPVDEEETILEEAVEEKPLTFENLFKEGK